MLKQIIKILIINDLKGLEEDHLDLKNKLPDILSDDFKITINNFIKQTENILENNRKPKNYLHYIDANNLYGWAMQQYLPTGNFKWIYNESLGICNTQFKSRRNY